MEVLLLLLWRMVMAGYIRYMYKIERGRKDTRRGGREREREMGEGSRKIDYRNYFSD